MAVDRNPNFAKLQAGYAKNTAVAAPTWSTSHAFANAAAGSLTTNRIPSRSRN